MAVRIIGGDALAVLRNLPDASVQCVVTSPPYFSLRDYGTATWEGGDAGCDHQRPALGGIKASTLNAKRDETGWLAEDGHSHPNRQQYRDVCGKCGAKRIDQQIGLEASPADFIAALMAVFDEVRRVLRTDGTCWVNLGDSYSGGGKGPTGSNGIGNAGKRQGFTQHARAPYGIPDKNLLLIPERFAVAMQDAGWIVRSRIAWCKTSAMPESVRDRPTSAWEHIWMFSKSARYFYDAEAVRQAYAPDSAGRYQYAKQGTAPTRLQPGQDDGRNIREAGIQQQNSAGANLRNFWMLKDSYERSAPLWTDEQRAYAEAALDAWWQRIVTEQPEAPPMPFWLLGPEPSKLEHYASYPTEIPKRCILAGTSERGQCPACGAPWVRSTTSRPIDYGMGAADTNGHKAVEVNANARVRYRTPTGHTLSKTTTETTGWSQSCQCDAGPPVPQTVLDPFLGSGTTALVADRLGRDAIGVELSPKYVEIARRRIESDEALFSAPVVVETDGEQLDLFAGVV